MTLDVAHLASLVENDLVTLEDAADVVLNAARQEGIDNDIPLEYVDSNGEPAIGAWRDLLVDSILACAMGDNAKMMDLPTGWQVTARTVVFTFDSDALVIAVDSWDK